MIESTIERNLEPQTNALAPQSEVLLGNVPLPFRTIFYPYGFAAEVITNAQEVLDAASESWGHFHERYTRPILQLHVVISEDSSIDCPPHPTVRAQRYILSIVADAQNQAVCDLKGGFASAWLSQSILGYRSYLRYHFIEAAVLALLSTSYVTAIHAACVSLHGQGMLLCGDSGAGKSSLSYACARAGWTYTSDDASYLLEGNNAPRVIGNSHQVRFRPSAKELFPELYGRDLTPRAEGKPSIEVPTSEFSNIITVDETEVQSIIYLNRQPSEIAELVPLSKEIAMERFYQSLYPVEEIRKTKFSALQRLFNLEIYELRYQHLHHAIDRLEQLARRKSIGPT